MAGRKNFYFDEEVEPPELNGAFAYLEQADRALVTDFSAPTGSGTAGGYVGIVANAQVTPHAAGANLTVDVSGSAIVYDAAGERITWGPIQNVSLAGATVAVSGHEIWGSIYAQYTRVLGDVRTDGNSDQIYFDQVESYQLTVVYGPEAAVGSNQFAAAPAAIVTTPASLSPPLVGGVLLADVQLTFGLTAITAAHINATTAGVSTNTTTRRQDAIVVAATSGGPYALRRGRMLDALTDVLSFLNGSALASAASLVASPSYASLASGVPSPSPQTLVLLSPEDGGRGVYYWDAASTLPDDFAPPTFTLGGATQTLTGLTVANPGSVGAGRWIAVAAGGPACVFQGQAFVPGTTGQREPTVTNTLLFCPAGLLIPPNVLQVGDVIDFEAECVVQVVGAGAGVVQAYQCSGLSPLATTAVSVAYQLPSDTAATWLHVRSRYVVQSGDVSAGMSLFVFVSNVGTYNSGTDFVVANTQGYVLTITRAAPVAGFIGGRRGGARRPALRGAAPAAGPMQGGK